MTPSFLTHDPKVFRPETISKESHETNLITLSIELYLLWSIPSASFRFYAVTNKVAKI